MMSMKTRLAIQAPSGSKLMHCQFMPSTGVRPRRPSGSETDLLLQQPSKPQNMNGKISAKFSISLYLLFVVSGPTVAVGRVSLCRQRRLLARQYLQPREPPVFPLGLVDQIERFIQAVLPERAPTDPSRPSITGRLPNWHGRSDGHASDGRTTSSPRLIKPV
jgi:hypothetical protein